MCCILGVAICSIYHYNTRQGSCCHYGVSPWRFRSEWSGVVTVTEMRLTTEDTVQVELVVTLGAYLSYIKSEELAKAESQRRSVPTIGELAEAAGVHRVTMQNLVTGDMKRINFETLTAVLNELRRRGFNPKVSDILLIRETNNRAVV